MDEYNSLKEIAKRIRNDNKKVTLLYAFNATGKTRLSMEFKNLVNEMKGEEEIKHIVYYNAFTEDLFYWDNDLENDIERKLKINTNAWFVDLIKKQGKENEIAKKFREFTSSRIEPQIDIEAGEITFNLPTGDEEKIENIKISKGEESVFIWSVFFVLMETIIDELNIDDPVDRSTDAFDAIRYIFIDDPVTSLDDNHLIQMAVSLKRIIKGSENDGLRFIITTHHSLFYNILFTEFTKANRFWLSKKDNKYAIQALGGNDSPFGYHLLLKEELKKAISSNSIKRYHFNLLRNLLETSAIFLGYGDWRDLIQEEDREGYIKRINLYSHSDHTPLEAKELEPQEQQFLARIFNNFINNHKWKE